MAIETNIIHAIPLPLDIECTQDFLWCPGEHQQEPSIAAQSGKLLPNLSEPIILFI